MYNNQIEKIDDFNISNYSRGNIYKQISSFNNYNKNKNKKKDKEGMRLNSMILVFLGMILIFVNGILILGYKETTKNYVSITADVVDYTFNHSFATDSNFFEQFITVHYNYEGKEYQKTFNPFLFRYIAISHNHDVLIKVNPNDPTEAVLHIKYEYFVFLGIGILIVIIGFIIYLLSHNKKLVDD